MLFDDLQKFLAGKSLLPKLLAVVGPTASGKTGVAVQIALKCKDGAMHRSIHGAEVVNADSRQMYKYLNIGIAKPTEEEMQNIPHHLFDFLGPKEECNVAQWRTLAEEKKLRKYEKEAIFLSFVVELWLYNALTQNFSIPSIPPIPEFRTRMETRNSEELWEELHKKDSEEAKKISPQNKRFLIRALEIYESTGVPKSEMSDHGEKTYDEFIICLTIPRDLLYKIIDQRVDAMKEAGFLDEVRELLNKGYSLKDPAMMSHGYREAIECIQGERTEEDLWETMKKNTRNYAKRQLTWWRRDKRVHWYDPVSLESIDIQKSEF